MSALSAQCNRLREMAESMRNAGRMSDACELSDAADTIEQLRDMAQNAVLGRECAREDLTELEEETKELNRENARLRELVRHLYACTEHSGCFMCPYVDEPCDFKYEMRECVIEVG